MKTPMVTICMITYNHESYIRYAIDGVLMQKTSFQIELIIGEDCSTDNTRKIIRDYENKCNGIMFVDYHKANHGMIDNLISAIKSARGKYIALCEGDDYWTDPLKLQKQVDFLEANPEYGLVSSDINLIDENGNPLPDNNMVKRQRENFKPTVDFFDLLKTNQINTLTVCARAELMKELASRIEKEKLWFVYDHWFWLNIALKSKIRVFNEKMASYRVHSQGVSSGNNFFKVRAPLVKFSSLKTAIKQKNINKFKVVGAIIDLFFKMIRNRNFEAIGHIIRLN